MELLVESTSHRHRDIQKTCRIRHRLLLFLNVLILYSSLVAAEGGLLIEQVVQGTAQNRAVQITYAGRGPPVDRSTLVLLSQKKGDKGWQRLAYLMSANAPNLLYPNDSFLVIHPSASNVLLKTKAEAVVLSNNLIFDGNVALSLAVEDKQTLDWTHLDQFGDPNNFPSDGWTVAGEEGATVRHTLVRRLERTSAGSLNWTEQAGTNANNSQWRVYPVDTAQLQGVLVDAPAVPPPSLPNGWCASPPPMTADYRPDPAKLTIGMWTVGGLRSGLLDPAGDPWSGGDNCNVFAPTLPCNESGRTWYSLAVARRVSSLNVDVLSLVDAEDCKSLSSVVQNVAPVTVGYIIQGEQGGATSSPSLLTRVLPTMELLASIENTTTLPPLPQSLCPGVNLADGSTSIPANSHFLTRLQVGGLRMVIISARMFGEERTCQVRVAQVRLLRALAMRNLQRGLEVALLVSFQTVGPMLGDGQEGITNNRTVQLLQDPNADGVMDLVEAAAQLHLSQAQAATYFEQEGAQGVQLDYILLSPGLAGYLQSVQVRRDIRFPNATKNHFPVLATLAVPPGSPPPPTTIAPPPPPLPSSPRTPGSPPSNTSGQGGQKRMSRFQVWLLALIIIAGTLVLCVTLGLLETLHRKRKRYVDPTTVAREEGLASTPWSPLPSSSAATLENLTEPPIRSSPTRWPPIDRTLFTIKSGEQLDMSGLQTVEEDPMEGLN